MKKTGSFNHIFKLMFIGLLLSNFNALSQKTTIWIVRNAEATDSTSANRPSHLTSDGQSRTRDLVKALKHEKIKAIYINGQRVGELTVEPLAQKDKILPRVYTGDLRSFATKILKNFEGDNVLIVGQYKTIIPLVEAFGGTPPFNEITNDDYDLLFSITINNSGKIDLFVNYYGKPHHATEIPQQYILDNYYPGYTPPITNH
jgi:2,3-bisphosphoglycerate-dependent phosphoglycerate mutase